MTGQPFTVLVDSSGRIVKAIRLSGDVEAPRRSEKPENPTQVQDQIQKDMSAIELGSATVGEDGSIYIMRATNPPRIYVLDPVGNQVRQFDIVPPGKNYEVVEFKVALGKVAAQFEAKQEGTSAAEQILSLIDAETGDRLVDYVSPKEIGGVLACYRPDSFLFLGQQEGRPVIQKVGP